MTANLPDIAAIFIDARREIAIAKLTELRFQSFRIGQLVRDGAVERGIAAEVLYDAAFANNLIATHGTETIEAVLAEGLAA